jgi:uncharacterized protein involved in type VI secretion and phage assembly
MDTPASSPFLLRVHGVVEAFDVARFRGRERMSCPYTFDLTVLTSRRIDTRSASLLARSAAFVMRDVDGTARSFEGVIVSQRLTGHPAPGDRQQVVVRLVSRLWLLERNRNTRIFQDTTVPAIVATVLNCERGQSEHGNMDDTFRGYLQWCLETSGFESLP